MSDLADNLAQQFTMLDVLWKQFEQHGVNETTELALDFMYYAPNRKSAEALRDVILNDHHAEVVSDGFLRKRWIVKGQTDPTPVTKDILREWLGYMVSTGWEYGCEFDGFGATMPNK